MKGFLTFTLAAGVAITTSSVVQAAGVGKGALNTSQPTSSQTAPMSTGAMAGFSLDRSSLLRELSRLSELLAPVELEADANTAVKQKSHGSWTW